jgi:hypothetical protein
VPWRRRARRGAPRKADAKRRRTTTSGRAPDLDRGSPELVRRKIHVANGSPIAVELADVVDVLFANELIVDEELVALRLLADWLRQLRVALQLRQASPGGSWAAITSGTEIGAIAMTSPAVGGDRALFRLGELFDYFTATGQLALLRLIIRVAGNEAHPENEFELARLYYGVQIVMQLQRRGRQASRPTPGWGEHQPSD